MEAMRVWVNDKPVGWIAPHNGTGCTFVYDRDVDPSDAVSLTMPVRVASYDQSSGLLPVFDTNLPEGVLLDRIRNVLAKMSGKRASDYEVLSCTGANQIGRIRILPEGQEPVRRPPVDNIEDILDRDATAQMKAEIFDRYALNSGVSGSSPKVLMEAFDPDQSERRVTLQTRDYILKFSSDDFPGLSLCEFHCLEAARLGGNDTVEARLSRDGRSLAIRRFDEIDGRRLGFEDFASLNAQTADMKYLGSVESSLFKTASAFAGKHDKPLLEKLYRQVVTNVALRNGDAHLKNFGVLFDDAAKGELQLTPAYDIVTTRAWMREDMYALLIAGSKRFPKYDGLVRLCTRAKIAPLRAREIISEVAEGIRRQLPVMVADLDARGEGALARKIAEEWNDGLVKSLNSAAVPVPELRDVAARVIDADVEDDFEPGL